MKKIISVIMLTLAAGVLAAQAETVNVMAPANAQGDFDVTVEVTNVFAPPHNGDDLVGFGFDFTYDNTVLQYEGETIGPLFDDLSANPGITADVLGAVDAGFLGQGDFTEPLILDTLHFSTIGVGNTTISITSDETNPDQGLQYFTSSDSFSASANVNATPEPGTFMLGGLALFGLVSARRVRRAPLSRL